jgi:hypothetical protein
MIEVKPLARSSQFWRPVLFLGALAWLQVAVGLFALGAGVWYLAEFWRNPDAVC